MGALIHRKGLALALSALALLAACQFQPPVTTFAEQRLSWFSYLAAHDIQAACTPGSPDHLRLVFNGGVDNRIRAYDLVALPDGAALLAQRVDRGIEVSQFNVSEVLSLGAPVEAERRVAPADHAQLRAALAESGVFDPPPVGLTLRANDPYWLVSGCVDGAMLTTGFRDPSDAYRRLTFPPLLARLDTTGVPFFVTSRGAADPIAGCSANSERGGPADCQAIRIGEDGLIGL